MGLHLEHCVYEVYSKQPQIPLGYSSQLFPPSFKKYFGEHVLHLSSSN